MVEITVFRNSLDAVAVPPGEVLFREGDPGTEMFAVVEGQVELSRDGQLIETVGADGIFGELALIDTTPRSATATVRDATRMVRVDRRRFTFLVHDHPLFALQVMKVMAERLRRTNTALSARVSPEGP